MSLNKKCIICTKFRKAYFGSLWRMDIKEISGSNGEPGGDIIVIVRKDSDGVEGVGVPFSERAREN